MLWLGVTLLALYAMRTRRARARARRQAWESEETNVPEEDADRGQT
jgi:hypothetical protein